MTDANNYDHKSELEIPNDKKDKIVPLKKPNKTEVLLALIRACEGVFSNPTTGLNTTSWEELEETRTLLRTKVQAGVIKKEGSITDLYWAGVADALAYVKTLREADRAELRKYNPGYL